MWVRDGKILDAERAFYSKVNCDNLIPDEVGFGPRTHAIDRRRERDARGARLHRYSD